jgi:hypothetical protein
MLGTRVTKPFTASRLGSLQRHQRCIVVQRSLPGAPRRSLVWTSAAARYAERVPCLRAARLSLHVGETTVQVPFAKASAEDLNATLLALLKTFSEKQQAERPKRWDAMEYKFKGSAPGEDLEYFEVFCNPNAYTSAFDAKVLVTIRSRDGISVTTEGRLSNFKADLDNYLG